MNAERVLERVDVTGLSSNDRPPQLEFAELQGRVNNTVTFKYDVAQYDLSVSGERFEIPAASTAVFRRPAPALWQGERSTDQNSTTSNSPPQSPAR